MGFIKNLKNFFERTLNMEIYIVTLDTTFAQPKLGKSLQNYGLCLASDANNARERFIQPLRQMVPPHILAELFQYVFAYKLTDITESLNEQHPMWAYVSTSPARKLGQQTKLPYVSSTFDNPDETIKNQDVAVAPAPIVAPPQPIVEEFKAPEGVTDPVQLAMLKTMFDMAKEIKTLKSAPAAAAPTKVSILDLEAQFRAPPIASHMPGSAPIDVNSIPIPQVPHVTTFPKGKIDRETKMRLEQNIRKTNFEVID
jgi:hypothetical protein